MLVCPVKQCLKLKWDVAQYRLRYNKNLNTYSLPFLQYSICKEPLIELSNPGASGSLFYLTSDDEFIIKTLQHKEAEFLQKLLPGYYMVSPSPVSELDSLLHSTQVSLLSSSPLSS